MEFRQQSDEDRKVFLGNLADLSQMELLNWLDSNKWSIANRSPFVVPKGDLVNLVRASGTVVGLRLELNKTSEVGRAAAGRGQFPGLSLG